jgi:hypothetical protein
MTLTQNTTNRAKIGGSRSEATPGKVSLRPYLKNELVFWLKW